MMRWKDSLENSLMYNTSRPRESRVGKYANRAGLLAGLCLALTGCSVHNMWNVSARAEAKPISSVHFPAHERKVLLTDSTLPGAAIRDMVAQIEVAEVTAKPTESVLLLMADQARAVGADAVTDLRIWRQGCGFSWVSPQASGTAVRVTDTNALTELNGYWY